MSRRRSASGGVTTISSAPMCWAPGRSLPAAGTHGVRRLVYTSTPERRLQRPRPRRGGRIAAAHDRLSQPLSAHQGHRRARGAGSEFAPSCARSRCGPISSGAPAIPIWCRGSSARARAGRLRIVGSGRNRVDLVHVENAVDAQLLAEAALAAISDRILTTRSSGPAAPPAAGKAYFITNGEPVRALGLDQRAAACPRPAAGDAAPVARRPPPRSARPARSLWRLLPLPGEPPMTRFVAKELATDHWFDISAARRDLGYAPRVSLADGMAELVASLKFRV